MNHKTTQEIPKILHFIWISHNNGNAKDISNDFYQNFLKTEKLVQKENNDWKIKIWTNQENDNFPKLKSIQNLGKQEIEIININSPGVIFNLDPQDKISSSDTQKQKKLYDKSYSLGIKIDILKYQILKEYGGIINDWNFVYNKLPNNLELNNYDLMLYKSVVFDDEYKVIQMIENCFMASTKKHSFITKAQRGIVANSKELKYCLDKDSEISQNMKEKIEFIINRGSPYSYDQVKQILCVTDITTKVATLNRTDSLN